MTPPTESPIPAPVPEDADDVELALETASALWAKGDRAEALRWLRRGAESAEQAGDDHRALTLARAAAEIDAEEPRPSLPAPPPAAPTANVAASVVPTPTHPPPKPVAARLSHPPPKPAPERVSQAPKPPSERASTAPRDVPGEAMRVYVKTSARDENLLIVRPLEPGRGAPPGTKLATLVFAEEQP